MILLEEVNLLGTEMQPQWSTFPLLPLSDKVLRIGWLGKAVLAENNCDESASLGS